MSDIVATPSRVDPAAMRAARERLDAPVREIVRWHSDPATACLFWVEKTCEFDFDPRTDINSANREFLHPYAAVVGVPPEQMEQMPAPMAKTLVATALRRDRRLVDRLLASPLVDRLKVGANQTNQISWDRPHEGNLVEHLSARRSFQRAGDAVLAVAAGA